MNSRDSAESLLLLEFQYLFLSKVDHNFPLGGHEADILEVFYLVQHIAVCVSMRTKKVVVSNPKSKVIVGAGNAVEAVRCPVRSFISPVESFDQLLHRTEFSGNSVGVGKADDLCDLKLHLITEFAEELLGSKRIGTVTVGDEPESFREVVFQLLESLAHCLDTGTDRTVHRGRIADDGTADGVHDEPDVGLHAADFDVGLIRNKDVARMIIVMIHEGFHTDGGCLTVIRDLLARDTEAIELFKGLGCFPKGELEVHMKGKAESHDVRVVLAET